MTIAVGSQVLPTLPPPRNRSRDRHTLVTGWSHRQPTLPPRPFRQPSGRR